MTVRIYDAIEIISENIWDTLCSIVPHLKELNYEENKGQFFVPDFDGVWAILSPKAVATAEMYIEPSSIQFKFVRLVKEM